MASAQRLITLTALFVTAGLVTAMVVSSCTEVRSEANGKGEPRSGSTATPDRVATGGAGGTSPGATAPGGQDAGGTDPTGRERVTIRGETFHLELSADEATRTQGLMYRTSIADDGGMLFVFPDSQLRAFWMKNCLVDMDLMFLDARGRVTALHRMKAEAPRGTSESEFAYERRMRLNDYASRFPAQFAIELKAGSIARLGLQVEHKIALDLPRLKALAR